jgi:CRISPR/Cas system-associated exonuclease Cas4 (RecB family)
VKISPTSVEAFDSTTPFGCERKWWFKYVAKVPDPGTSNQKLGTDLHAAVERFLLKGAPGEMAPDVARLFAGIKPEVIRVREEGFLDLERPVDFELAPDIRVVGRIDVVRKEGPLDWKTTSDLKYAPTPFKLAQSTQMLLYSAWQAEAVHRAQTRDPVSACAMPSQVTHVYVQTKGQPIAQRIDANMTSARLTEGRNRIINLVSRMEAAEKSKVEDLPRSPEKCFRCPYKDICPADKETIMLATDRLRARLNSTATATAPAPQAVTPPDAPAPVKNFERKLEIQAETPVAPPAPAPMPPPPAAPAPVETPAPIPAQAEAAPVAPKRGPGRPPGSKNKPKEPTTEELIAAQGNPAVNAIVFRSVTVAMTGKLNMGHYQSLDIHVSQTADYSGDPNEAFMKLTDVVKKQLDAALESVAGRTVQAPVPAEVLGSTKR